MMTHDEALQMLSARVDGELTPEQELSLEAWLREHPDGRVMAEAFQTQDCLTRKAFEPRRAAATRTARLVASQIAPPAPALPARLRAKRWGQWVVAPPIAGIAVLLLIAIFCRPAPGPGADSKLTEGDSELENLALADRLAETHVDDFSFAVTPREKPTEALVAAADVGDKLTTNAGEKRRFTLPDGSVVYLNQNTTAEMAADRLVKLERGQIFVEAVPADEAAGRGVFRVETAERTFTALGTKFAIDAAGKAQSVLVTQGSVKFDDVAEPVKSGQELQLMDGVAPALAPAKLASYELDWTRELMIAADSPLVPASQYDGGALVAIDSAGQEAKLSLVKYNIDVHIEDGFARTTIDQTYFNHENARMEGTFYFPLPPDASISRLAMYVDNNGTSTLMEGGMAERDYARQTFERIRNYRRDPALLEWIDGSLFKMRVFPLEGRQEKRIVLSYTQKLPALYGRATYRFPAGHSLNVVKHWSFAATVKGGAAVSAASPSHPGMKIERAGNDLVLSDKGDQVKIDRDVVIELTEKKPAAADSVRWSSAEHEGAKYLMLRYRPELQSAPKRERRDWVFLFEASANRDPLIARAQVEVLRALLKQAEHNDTFALLTVGTHIHQFSDKPLLATEQNAHKALAYLDKAHLVGALNLEQALDDAAPLLAAADNPYLVHVGGGSAALGEQQPDKLIARIPQGTRYVGVAVGKRFSPAFMKAAAEKTSGFFTTINPDEPIAWRGFELAATLNIPRLLDTAVSVPAPQAPLRFLQFTNALAQGEELTAVARIEGALPSTITVRGSLDGASFERTIEVKNVTPNAGYLPRTWAKLEIDRLLAEDANNHRQRIIDLSKAMYVMTPFTSLLVLENDAMYSEFKVDRGRKDHWAMYACPQTIPTVYDRAPSRPEMLNDALDRERPANQVLPTIMMRSGPVYFDTFQFLLPLSGTSVNGHASFEEFGVDVNSVLGDPASRRYLVDLYPSLGPNGNRSPSVATDGSSATQALGRESGKLATGPVVINGPVSSAGRLMDRDILGRESIKDMPSVTDGLAQHADSGSAGGRGGSSGGRRDGPGSGGGGFGGPGGGGGGFGGGLVGPGGGGAPSGKAASEPAETVKVVPLTAVDPYLIQQAIDAIQGRAPISGALGLDPSRRGGAGEAFGINTWQWSDNRFYTGGIVGPPFLTSASTDFLSSYYSYPLYEGRSNQVFTGSTTLSSSGAASLGSAPVGFKMALVTGNEPTFMKFAFTSGNAEPVAKALAETQTASPTAKIISVGDEIWIWGNPQDHVEIGKQLAILNKKDKATALASKVITLRTLEASKVVAQLKGRFTDRSKDTPVIAGDKRNGIVISGTAELVQEVIDFIHVLEPQADVNGVMQPGARRSTTGFGDVQFVKLGLVGGQPLASGNFLSLLIDPILGEPPQGPAYYKRPSFNGKDRVFTDLASYAPGMNSTVADVAAVLEAETGPRLESRRGTVDQAARERIDQVRTASWRRLTIKDATGAECSLYHDGRGRYAYEHRVDFGLVERVVCDGSTILHLYPELGIGARRNVSRFHRAQLCNWLPDVVPPVDDLNLGADVKMVDANTVAIVPIAPAKAENQPARTAWIETHLVFEGNRLAQRRWLLMPARQELARAVFEPDGTIKLFDANGEEAVSLKRNVKPAEQPDIQPDLASLVVLPLPLRSRESVYRKYNLDPYKALSEGTNVRFEALAPEAALELLTCEFAAGVGNRVEEIWHHCFANRGDRRAGFFTLVLSSGPDRRDRINQAIRAQVRKMADNNSVTPLMRYLSLAIDPDVLYWQRQLGLMPGQAPAADFLGNLLVFRALTARWQGNAVGDRFLGHRASERERALAFVRQHAGDAWGWCTLALVADKACDGEFRLQIAALWGVLAEKSVLPYYARYEQAANLLLAGERSEAQDAFRKLFVGTLVAGYLPAVDGRFRDAFFDGKGTIEQEPQLWRMASKIAERRGDRLRQFDCLEKALDLEFNCMPAVFSLEPIRTDYGNLLRHYEWLADASRTLKAPLPADLLARTVRSADRWRALDPEVNPACEQAAKILRLIGGEQAKALAWDFATTPLAMRPKESAPWLSMAQSAMQEGNLALADQCYESAFAAEPANAQILWDRSRLLERRGEIAQRRKVLEQIAAGDWQPQFEGLKTQARQIVVEER
jgi:tetratricopeptide (TPR) repeat protein